MPTNFYAHLEKEDLRMGAIVACPTRYGDILQGHGFAVIAV